MFSVHDLTNILLTITRPGLSNIRPLFESRVIGSRLLISINTCFVVSQGPCSWLYAFYTRVWVNSTVNFNSTLKPARFPPRDRRRWCPTFTNLTSTFHLSSHSDLKRRHHLNAFETFIIIIITVLDEITVQKP